jgi:uncharacterized protein YifN (PemK superfamily)
MIVVTDDARSEAQRLRKQGTNIVPAKLTEALLRSVTGIDGTILLDPHGMCHAIGVILDGAANDSCTPSRGSRFNSGIRYVQPEHPRRLAIIVSEDRSVDIVPILRPLLSRTLLENHLAALERSTLDNFHEHRSWFDDHRFYLNSEQCARVNAQLTRLDEIEKEVGYIYFKIPPFVVAPDMDESYLIE